MLQEVNTRLRTVSNRNKKSTHDHSIDERTFSTKQTYESLDLFPELKTKLSQEITKINPNKSKQRKRAFITNRTNNLLYYFCRWLSLCPQNVLWVIGDSCFETSRWFHNSTIANIHQLDYTDLTEQSTWYVICCKLTFCIRMSDSLVEWWDITQHNTTHQN